MPVAKGGQYRDRTYEPSERQSDALPAELTAHITNVITPIAISSRSRYH